MKLLSVFRWEAFLFVIGITAGPLWQWFGYRMGYSHSHPIPFLPFAMLLDFCLRFAFIPVIISLAFRGFFFWKKRHNSAFVYLLMVVFVICSTILVKPLQPKIPFTKGFLARIQDNVSFLDLQSSCIAVLDNQTVGQDYEDAIDLIGNSIRIPKLLQTIWVHPPSYVIVQPNEGEVAEHFRVIWRGWIGDFGIAVGREDFILPEYSNHEQIQWESGVYVWWEGE